VITWLQAKKVRYKEVDAINDKDVRTELTNISGVKGNYPQVFISDQENETTFIGTYETIESLVELDDLDPAMLEGKDLKTFKQTFADCIEDA